MSYATALIAVTAAAFAADTAEESGQPSEIQFFLETWNGNAIQKVGCAMHVSPDQLEAGTGWTTHTLEPQTAGPFSNVGVNRTIIVLCEEKKSIRDRDAPCEKAARDLVEVGWNASRPAEFGGTTKVATLFFDPFFSFIYSEKCSQFAAYIPVTPKPGTHAKTKEEADAAAAAAAAATAGPAPWSKRVTQPKPTSTRTTTTRLEPVVYTRSPTTASRPQLPPETGQDGGVQTTSSTTSSTATSASSTPRTEVVQPTPTTTIPHEHEIGGMTVWQAILVCMVGVGCGLLIGICTLKRLSPQNPRAAAAQRQNFYRPGGWYAQVDVGPRHAYAHLHNDVDSADENLEDINMLEANANVARVQLYAENDDDQILIPHQDDPENNQNQEYYNPVYNPG